MESMAELRSKCFMRSIELLAKRVGCEVNVMVRFLDGRGMPPMAVVQRLRTETADTPAQYYEVVDDPMESTSGKALAEKVNAVVGRLDTVLSWYTPVGLRRRAKKRVSVTPTGYRTFDSDAWCLVNRFGETVSPWMTKEALRTYLIHLDLHKPFSAASSRPS